MQLTALNTFDSVNIINHTVSGFDRDGRLARVVKSVFAKFMLIKLIHQLNKPEDTTQCQQSLDECLNNEDMIKENMLIKDDYIRLKASIVKLSEHRFSPIERFILKGDLDKLRYLVTDKIELYEWATNRDFHNLLRDIRDGKVKSTLPPGCNIREHLQSL
ncbi:hypothetical protein [Candidatus Magnetominusculus dajiuhuensis]|uniref:hypothetical protein n=1 Tax=Candidatus Magnetominusculus dajiuhuensis TaxID=3137712 RepID=UPI003B43A1C2